MNRFRCLALLLTLLLALAACAPAAEGSSTSSPAAPAEESAPSQSPGQEEAPDPSAPVPILEAFTAADLAGEEVDQSIFSGYDLTMVNVWATFCGPCLREMPDLGALHQEFSGEKFQIVGIVTDVLAQDGSIDQDQVELAKQIAEETGANYRHLLPSEDLTARLLWQVNSVPTTIFVDEQGYLVGQGYLGSRDAGAWRAIIQEKLAEVRGGEDAQ